MIFSLAFNKVVLTDDAAPVGAPATQFDAPDVFGDGLRAGTVAAYIEFLDVGNAEVAGASCSLQLWLQDVGTAKWFRVDVKQQSIGGRRVVAFGLPPLNRATKGYLQVTDFSGTAGVTQIKVYFAVTGAMLPGFDLLTGSLRVRDILQRGGEQNALGIHRIALAGHASPDGGVAWDDSAALEASSVTKAAPGNLYGFVVHNTNAAKRYLQFYDATSVPADGAVPKLCYELPAASSRAEPIIGGEKRYFATGICWALSTTLATKTLGAAEAFGHIAYV